MEKAYGKVAAHEIIIDDLPVSQADTWNTEFAKVIQKLRTMMNDFKPEYIKHIQRIQTPNPQGFFPMKVTIIKLSVVAAMNEHVSLHPNAFPWFRRSRTKETRKFNSYEHYKAEKKNALLPDNSAFVWEATPVASSHLCRKVPNPNFVPPSVPQPRGSVVTTILGHQLPLNPWKPKPRPPQGGQQPQQPQQPQANAPLLQAPTSEEEAMNHHPQ